MIKGWKNDPQWVTYYEAKVNAARQRKIDKIKASYLLKDQLSEMDYQIRMRNSLSAKIVCS